VVGFRWFALDDRASGSVPRMALDWRRFGGTELDDVLRPGRSSSRSWAGRSCGFIGDLPFVEVVAHMTRSGRAERQHHSEMVW
jgi:hypothetical protein